MLACMIHANIDADSSTLVGQGAWSSILNPNDRTSRRRDHASHVSKMAATAIQTGLAPSMPAKPHAKTTASATMPLSFNGSKSVQAICGYGRGADVSLRLGRELGTLTRKEPATRGRNGLDRGRRAAKRTPPAVTIFRTLAPHVNQSGDQISLNRVGDATGASAVVLCVPSFCSAPAEPSFRPGRLCPTPPCRVAVKDAHLSAPVRACPCRPRARSRWWQTGRGEKPCAHPI